MYACSSAKNFMLTEAKKVEYRQNHKHIAPDLVAGLVKPSTASDVYSYRRLFKNGTCYYIISELPSSTKDIIKLCLRYNHARLSNHPDLAGFSHLTMDSPTSRRTSKQDSVNPAQHTSWWQGSFSQEVLYSHPRLGEK